MVEIYIEYYKGDVSVEQLEKRMVNETKLCSRCLFVLWLVFFKKKFERKCLSGFLKRWCLCWNVLDSGSRLMEGDIPKQLQYIIIFPHLYFQANSVLRWGAKLFICVKNALFTYYTPINGICFTTNTVPVLLCNASFLVSLCHYKTNLPYLSTFRLKSLWN